MEVIQYIRNQRALAVGVSFDMGQELEMNIDLFIQIIELFNEYDNVQEYTDKFIEYTIDELENDGYDQEEIEDHFKELDIELPKKTNERGR